MTGFDLERALRMLLLVVLVAGFLGGALLVALVAGALS